MSYSDGHPPAVSGMENLSVISQHPNAMSLRRPGPIGEL